MLMPKKDRVKIYEYLFEEGVIVAKKDKRPTYKHPDIDVQNLYVVKALESLASRGYVRGQYAWRHYYWFLTNEGITYIREFLHLPPEIVPSTLKRQVRPDTMRTARPGDAPSEAPAAAQDGRMAYRRGPASMDQPGGKDVGPGAGMDMQFRGGGGGGSFGRGRGTPFS